MQEFEHELSHGGDSGDSGFRYYLTIIFEFYSKLDLLIHKNSYC